MSDKWRERDVCGNEYGPEFTRAADGFWQATEDGKTIVLARYGDGMSHYVVRDRPDMNETHNPAEPDGRVFESPIIRQRRDDDAWRRQDGTKYESAVEELNAVWGKGRHDDICEELHDVMDGGKFRRAWEANGGKWGCVRDKKYDRMKEGPRISSNGQMKEALRISRSVNGKKGFATYGD